MWGFFLYATGEAPASNGSPVAFRVKPLNNPMKYHVKGLVAKSIDEEKGILDAVVGSTEVLDRAGEIIKQDGWVLDNYKKNPAVLWAHNAGFSTQLPPIGKAIKVWLEGARKKKLMFSIQFDMADPFAADIFRKYKDGFLNAFSVGFMPMEREDNTYTKSELLEISAVPVPANPEALAKLRSFEPKSWQDLLVKQKSEEGQDDHEEEDVEQTTKGVVPFSDTPTLAKETDWDAAGARTRLAQWASSDGSGDKDTIDWDKYAKGFAWFDAEKKESFGSYKLPHHDIQSGQLKTVWRGVTAAMAVMLGSRGGVNLPDNDRKAVYMHLSKHYDQYGEEAPEFRHVENQTLKALEYETDAIYEEKKSVSKEEVEDIVRQTIGIYKKKMQVIQNHNIRQPLKKDNEVLPQLTDTLKILVTASNIALSKIKSSKNST